MTGRWSGADRDRQEPAPSAPDFHVVRGPDDDLVEVGGSDGSSRRTRLVLLGAAAVLAVAGGASWWWSEDEAEDPALTADLAGTGRLVVDAGAEAGGEVDLRVDVEGRTRCQGVSRLEVTGRSLCGAGAVVAVVAPTGCRVRFETTAAPPVEATRLDVPGTGLAIAAAVLDARAVTPGVRPVVVNDAGGRRLLADLAGPGGVQGCGPR